MPPRRVPTATLGAGEDLGDWGTLEAEYAPIVLSGQRPLCVRGGARALWVPFLAKYRLGALDGEEGDVVDPRGLLTALCRAPEIVDQKGESSPPAPHSPPLCCVVEERAAPFTGRPAVDGVDPGFEAQKDSRIPLTDFIESIMPDSLLPDAKYDETATLRYMCELYLREVFPEGRPYVPWFDVDGRCPSLFLSACKPASPPKHEGGFMGMHSAGRLDSFFCGPRGSHSNLHADDPLGTAVIHVLSGAKRLLVWPPEAGPDGLALALRTQANADNQLAVHFPVSTSRADVLDLVDALGGYCTVVQSGDSYFVPPGWWHVATNIAPGLTLSVHDMVAFSRQVPGWLSRAREPNFAAMDVLHEIIPAKLHRAQFCCRTEVGGVLSEGEWEEYLQVAELFRGWHNLPDSAAPELFEQISAAFSLWNGRLRR
jgi:Cupin-like domain